MFNSNASSADAGGANYIEDVFSTWLYTGNGSTQTITNGIDLAGEGGLVWIKSRNAGQANNFYDTARGVSKVVFSNSTSGEFNFAGYGVTNFGSTGFSVTDNSIADYYVNGTGTTYASWTFRKQPKFFDVVTYTGAGSVDYAHALGSVPGFALYKATDGTSNWNCVCRKSDGTYELLQLNTTASTFTTFANAAAAGLTSTTFNPSGAGSATPGTQFVVYLFAHDAGGFGLTGTDNVISCGSYTGSNGAGQTINLGYEPQWLLVKNTSRAGQNWVIVDNMRQFDLTGYGWLYPNSSSAEASGTDAVYVSPTATGFRTYGNNAAFDYETDSYIYIAIRRGPMKVPTTGTSVYNPLLQNGTGTSPRVLNGAGFAPDFALLANRSGVVPKALATDRLRGNTISLGTYSTSDEAGFTGNNISLTQDGLSIASTGSNVNSSGVSYIHYLFQRAPGFFDEVCVTGTGSALTTSHNLGAVPELMIVKSRSVAEQWLIYHAALGNTKFLYFTTGTPTTSSLGWNNTSPTSTQLTIGAGWSGSGVTLVGYLFATCPGVSKVGSYTGTGTTQTINCGFTAGSRFVLIKRTDSTGDWYVWDSARGIVAGNDPYLLLNSTAAEVTGTDYVDTAATGFEISSTAPAAINASGGTYIFLAIA
jgi:hypothetical protein